MNHFYTDSVTDFESSNLEALYWDRQTWTLYVCFLSGAIVGYKSVGESVWNILKHADSKGSAYNSWIRGKYTGLGVDVLHDDLVPREPKSAEVVTAVKKATTFVVKGNRVEQVEQSVVALSLSDAVTKFLTDNPDVSTVTEVTIKIV